MPLPSLSDAQIAWVTHEVESYIENQRLTFRGRAVPLSGPQTAAMRPFFSALTLKSARVTVLKGQRVTNPPFYKELTQMGFTPEFLPDFALMAAITYVDTVVSHDPLTDRLLFHELVHVVQYERLGLPDFAAKYVKGFLSGGSYQAIPLEMNAYELDARFTTEPTKPFSVAAEVQGWIGADRF